MLHGDTQFGFEFKESKREIDAQNNLYLSEHSLALCTKEYFNLQALLYPLGEELELPAFLVEIGNGLDLIGIDNITVFPAGF